MDQLWEVSVGAAEYVRGDENVLQFEDLLVVRREPFDLRVELDIRLDITEPREGLE